MRSIIKKILHEAAPRKFSMPVKRSDERETFMKIGGIEVSLYNTKDYGIIIKPARSYYFKDEEVDKIRFILKNVGFPIKLLDYQRLQLQVNIVDFVKSYLELSLGENNFFE